MVVTNRFHCITIKTLWELRVKFGRTSSLTIPLNPRSAMSTITSSRSTLPSFQLGSSTGQPPRELRRFSIGCGPKLSISAIQDKGSKKIHDDVIKWEHFPRYWPFCGKFPAQRPVTRSFDVFFDLCLNKQLSKQSWGCWFETQSRSLWRQCNELCIDVD